MRTTRVLLTSIVLSCGLVGCTSTGGLSKRARTVASVGDKPLPVVTGEPGSTVVADRQPPVRTRRVAGRISGRVLDESGEPMANVRVRLAVNEAKGGKVVHATTDRTGAFTLQGLRPGSSYTVIAEDERGERTGRSEVRAPDTDVRIQLASADAEVIGEVGDDASPRVSPVSEREPVIEESEVERPRRSSRRSTRPRVNDEDLPPAPEAESFESGPSEPEPQVTSAAATRRSKGPRVARWHPSDDEAESGGAKSKGAKGATVDPEAHGTGAMEPEPGAKAEPEREARTEKATETEADPPAAEDEERNPLPPALEPGHTSSLAPATGENVPSATRVATINPFPFPDSGPAESDPDPFAEPQPKVQGLPPADSAAPTEAAGLAGPIETPGSHQSPESRSVAQADEPTDSIPPASPIPATRRAPTWKELAAQTDPASIPREPGPRTTTTRLVADAGAPPRLDSPSSPGRPRAAPPAVPPDDSKSSCDYDAKYRRIRDFRLPDLEGRPVRFHDLDADLVLLDFWGTWCQPCIRSIPHLVDLQKKVGTARLKVVGIACEQGPPPERAGKVASEARRLGINYPVLLSGMDGSCPLQEALHIQAFPTLILVDRQGRIVWRDQGATPTTLAKLDRFIDAGTHPDVRRY